jgi:hypothetical protein
MSRATDSKPCPVCGTVFTRRVNESRHTWARRRGCSRECARGNTPRGQWLTPDEVRAIRAIKGTARSIALTFGVSETTVASIRSGQSWAWLK